MGRGDTFRGAHHINLEKEIQRQIEELKKGIMGHSITDVSKINVSDFIVERNKKTLMTNKEMLDFWKRKKGIS